MPEPYSIQGLFNCQQCATQATRRFCSLSDKAMRSFEAIGSPVAFKAGAQIFTEDSVVNGVYVLCSGRVKLSTTSARGKTLILRIAQAGDLLGLSAVLSGSPYEVTAETLEATRLKKISSQDFLHFLSSQVEASVHAAEEMSSEYRSVLVDVKRITLCTSAPSRLASLLMDWVPRDSRDRTTARLFMPLSHEELANLIGSSRETVTRALGRFRKEKLIAIKGVHLEILSLDRLRTMAAG